MPTLKTNLNKAKELKIPTQMLGLVSFRELKRVVDSVWKEINTLEQKYADFLKYQDLNLKYEGDHNALKKQIETARDELTKGVKKLEAGIKAKQDELVQGLNEQEVKLRQAIDTETGSLRESVTEVSNNIASLREGLSGLSSLEEGLTEITDTVKEFEKKIEDIDITPEATRDRLASLEGDERLDKTAIKGLVEELKEMRKEVSAKTSGGVRRVFQPYVKNFQADTDGTTKVFYLDREPLRTNTVKAWGSDFPHIITEDFGLTIEGKKVTLDDDLPAPSTGSYFVIEWFA